MRSSLQDKAQRDTRHTQRVWLALLMGCSLAMLLVLLLGPAPPAAPVRADTDPTPTPTPLSPLRPHDPPAPPHLALHAGEAGIETVQIGGYPRIVKLWGGYDPRVGLDFYARYDVMITQAFSDEQLLALRDLNPNLIVLYTGLGTYDLADGPLGSQWMDALPGSPEFECFYRGTDLRVLRVPFWNHGMFNLGDEWCREQIGAYLVSQMGSQVGSIYDGVFFDRIYQAITPSILYGIDLDHDGRVDGLEEVNELYWRGTERFLDAVRRDLGEEIVLLANDAPLVYTSRLNGREYESFIRGILDQNASWTQFRYDYEQWMQAAREPRLTMVMSNPPAWMEKKYGLPPWQTMKPAVVDEAASYYARMRFGLATALMDGGLYSYEFGTTWHGNAWWYDEYDGGGLGKGYLGAPQGAAYLATGPLTTPHEVQNPGFEDSGLAPWTLYSVQGDALWSQEPITAPINSTVAARVFIPSGEQAGDVRLEQDGIKLIKGQVYTLSFWGRASRPLWGIEARLHPAGRPDTSLGLRERLNLGTTWQQYRASFRATATATDAVLSAHLGGHTGTVWIDEVALQQGALPTVYRRDFQRGSALVNATWQRETIPLGSTYVKIAGTQAPLAKIVIDDAEKSTAEFLKIGGWAGHTAGYDDWGSTYHHALTTQDPNLATTRAVWRPDIVYAGPYAVYAWVAPHDKVTGTFTYTVQHAAGLTQVPVEPGAGVPAWADLGTFFLDAGTDNAVTLTNHSRSPWVVADAVKFESLRRYNDGAEVTSVTLEGRDGIVLLGSPPARGDLVLTASDPAPLARDVLTYTLRFCRADLGAEPVRVRVIDALPEPGYLSILTPTISGGAVYSSEIGGVVWEGELAQRPPVRVTYQVQVTDTVPQSGYAIQNTATMVNLSAPERPVMSSASARIDLQRRPVHRLLLPLVLRTG